jgi:hypothetical protein
MHSPAMALKLPESSLEPAFVHSTLFGGGADRCSLFSPIMNGEESRSTSAGSSPPTSPLEDSLELSPYSQGPDGYLQTMGTDCQVPLNLRSSLEGEPRKDSAFTPPARKPTLSLDNCIEERKFSSSPFGHIRAPPGLANGGVTVPVVTPVARGRHVPGLFIPPTPPGSLGAAAAAASAAVAMSLAAQRAARSPMAGRAVGQVATSSPKKTTASPKKSTQVLCLALAIEEQAHSPASTASPNNPFPSTTVAEHAQHHRAGACRPCAFFHRKGCSNGLQCTFCHICGPGEKKRRQKDKLASHRQHDDTEIDISL